jgi:hypothetical protein
MDNLQNTNNVMPWLEVPAKLIDKTDEDYYHTTMTSEEYRRSLMAFGTELLKIACTPAASTEQDAKVKRLAEWAAQVVEWAESRKFIFGMENVAETGRTALAALKEGK